MNDIKKTIRDDIDSYEETIEAIISFCNIIEYDFGGIFSIGRKMDTSQKNKVSPLTTVTPDIVAEFKNDENEHGIIGEVKLEFPNDEQLWLADIKQTIKYDDILIGWKNKISDHDIILLTHHLRSYRLAQFIKKLLESNEISFDRNFSIVEFIRNSQANTYFDIKKTFGKITCNQLDDKLSAGVGVPTNKIIAKLTKIKFYDAEPPVIYTMLILWDFVFSYLTQEKEIIVNRGKRVMEINTNIDDVLKIIKERFSFSTNSEREPEIPKRKWITKAMDELVKINLAKDLGGNKYLILYKRITGGKTTDFFIERLYKNSKQKKITDKFKNSEHPV